VAPVSNQSLPSPRNAGFRVFVGNSFHLLSPADWTYLDRAFLLGRITSREFDPRLTNDHLAPGFFLSTLSRPGRQHRMRPRSDRLLHAHAACWYTLKRKARNNDAVYVLYPGIRKAARASMSRLESSRLLGREAGPTYLQDAIVKVLDGNKRIR
jgi:hypothetical protein